IPLLLSIQCRARSFDRQLNLRLSEMDAGCAEHWLVGNFQASRCMRSVMVRLPRMTTNLNTRRSRLIVALIAFVIAIAVATGVWSVIASGIPPRTVTLATGPEGSAYAQIGERYRAILARSGVDLQLQATAGS